MGRETLLVEEELHSTIRDYPGSNDTERLKNWKNDRENVQYVNTIEDVKQVLFELGVTPEQIKELIQREVEAEIEAAKNTY